MEGGRREQGMGLFSRLVGGAGGGDSRPRQCPYFLSTTVGVYCDVPGTPQRVPLIEGLGGISADHIDRFCRGSFKSCPLYR